MFSTHVKAKVKKPKCYCYNNKKSIHSCLGDYG